MNSDNFISSLEGQLKGFPREERAALVEEIASHLESGEDDPALGESRTDRQYKLAQEMGTPEQIGRGFKAVHRPNRLADLLWVVIPMLLISLFSMGRWDLVFSLPLSLDEYLYLSIRVIMLLSIGLVVVGLRRRSILGLLYWIPHSMGSLVTLMTREERWLFWQGTQPVRVIESSFWTVLLLGLAVWLARLLWRHRNDLLLVLFGLLPLLVTVANVTTITFVISSNFQRTWPGWWIGLMLGERLITFGGLALVFLMKPRDLRWLGLFLLVLPGAFLNITGYWPLVSPTVIWTIFLGVILLAWGADRFQRGLYTRRRAL
jgi:hypothetical protein